MEEKAKSALEAQVGKPLDRVDCPEGIDAKVGASLRCVIYPRVEPGESEVKLGMTATVSSVTDGTTHLDFKVDDHVME